jgi:hypothetical protein
LDRLYGDIVRTLKERLAVAEDKGAQTKRGHQVDIATVAESVAETVRPLLESQSFPDSFIRAGAATQTIDFSRAGKLELECHPMMGQAMLTVRNGKGEVLIHGQYARSICQVIIKSILFGRKNFSYPIEPASADATLQEFSKWFPKVLTKIAEGCAMSAVGTSYEVRVYDAVLKALHLDANISQPEFFGHLTINN